MSFMQWAMLASGLCYVASAIGWWVEGRPWMAATFGLYAATIGTLYLAGRAS